MIIAVYFLLAWTVVGFIAAVLMGRAIAAGSGEQRRDVSAQTEASAPARACKEKPLPAPKARAA